MANLKRSIPRGPRRQALKTLFVASLFLLGEVTGIGSFVIILQMYHAQFRFELSTFQDFLNVVWLVLLAIMIPLRVAKQAARTFDAFY